MGKHHSPESRQEVFALKAQGKTIKEISAKTGIPEGTISWMLASNKDLVKKGNKNQVKQIIIPKFNYEDTLDAITEKLYDWFKAASTRKKASKDALQVVDRFLLAYRAHKGQVDININNVTNIQQVFCKLDSEAQLTIISLSPQWTALVEELAKVLEGCGGCAKVKDLIERLTEAK